jgi:hypothetical protein
MRLSFLGHQGWMIEADGDVLLVDPVLTPSFGSTPRVRFAIYPPRKLDLARMPAPDAVVLTTDHIQHFHLDSLRLLPRATPIYVGVLFCQPGVDAIRELGFEVKRVPPSAAFAIGRGGLRGRLLPAGGETPTWDKRTTSLFVESARRSVLVQSDIAASDVVTALAKYARTDVSAVICTNNSQLPVWPQRGAWANQLPLPSDRSHGPVGLRVLRGVLLEMANRFKHFPMLILNGNGHLALDHFHGPFLWGQKELEAAAQALSLGQRVWGPEPGESRDLDGDAIGSAGWVAVDPAASDALDDKFRSMRLRDIAPIFDPAPDDLERVRAGLDRLTAPLLMSRLGRCLAARDDYAGKPLLEERFAIRLRTREGDRVLALDVARARWTERPIPGDRVMEHFPFGIDVHLADLAALLDGRIQAWELCSTSFKQWFVGAQLDCPAAFLYTYFDEANRTDLSAANYHQQLGAA